MASEKGTPAEAPLHAVSAEFITGDALLASVLALKGRGLGRLDAHSPVPIQGMSRALDLDASSMSGFAVGAVTLGFLASMGMCIYATAADYVFNIGGRPLISWPAFVVPSVSFSLMMGALVVYVAMLFLNRLPRLNHPSFNIPDFQRVTQDRYFLTVEAGRASPRSRGRRSGAARSWPPRPSRSRGCRGEGVASSSRPAARQSRAAAAARRLRPRRYGGAGQVAELGREPVFPRQILHAPAGPRHGGARRTRSAGRPARRDHGGAGGAGPRAFRYLLLAVSRAVGRRQGDDRAARLSRRRHPCRCRGSNRPRRATSTTSSPTATASCIATPTAYPRPTAGPSSPIFGRCS